MKISRACACATAVAFVLSTRHADCFLAEGHDAIEVKAYASLAADKVSLADHPSGREVLCSLIENGYLKAPNGFTGGGACRKADILRLPNPTSGSVDKDWTLQTGDAGQCYHFMATRIDDMKVWKDTWPFQLNYAALPRCLRLLDRLADRATNRTSVTREQRQKAMSQLMHAVEDSYSKAHTVRKPEATGKIVHLMVWDTIAWYGGPDETHHGVSDDRDEDFLLDYKNRERNNCAVKSENHWIVPDRCFSSEAKAAVAAVVAMLRTIYEMSRSQYGPIGSAPWASFKEAHFSSAVVFDQERLDEFSGEHAPWCWKSECPCDCQTDECRHQRGMRIQDPSCTRDFETTTLIAPKLYLTAENSFFDAIPGQKSRAYSASVGLLRFFPELGHAMNDAIGGAIPVLNPFAEIFAGVAAPLWPREPTLRPFVGFRSTVLPAIAVHPAFFAYFAPLEGQLYLDRKPQGSMGINIVGLGLRASGLSYKFADSPLELGATYGKVPFFGAETDWRAFSFNLGMALDGEMIAVP